MPPADPIARIRALLDEIEAELAAQRALLIRCRQMCGDDSMTLGPIATALAAEIDQVLRAARDN